MSPLKAQTIRTIPPTPPTTPCKRRHPTSSLGYAGSEADDSNPTPKSNIKDPRSLFIAQHNGTTYVFRTPRPGENFSLSHRTWLVKGVLDEEAYFQESVEQIKKRYERKGKKRVRDGVSTSASLFSVITGDHQGIIDLTPEDGEDDMVSRPKTSRAHETSNVDLKMDIDQSFPLSEKYHDIPAPVSQVSDPMSHNDSPRSISPHMNTEHAAEQPWTEYQMRALWLAQLRHGEGLNWGAVAEAVNSATVIADPFRLKTEKDCQSKWREVRRAAFGDAELAVG